MAGLDFIDGGRIIGMVHFPALPGAPLYDSEGGMRLVRNWVERDVLALLEGGIDAIMFCNEGDRPYRLKAGPETVAAMGAVIGAVRDLITVPFGVDVLWDPLASIALAVGTGAGFVREVFTGTYPSDMGLWNTNAAAALRCRRELGGDHIKLLFNIQAEFAGRLDGRPLGALAKSVVFSSLADAVCVSGPMTGQPADLNDLRTVRAAVPTTPVIANTGVRADTVAAVLAEADGAIVGTALKYGGKTFNPVDPDRVHHFMLAARAATQEPPV
jgi:hypothetical protein